jgi:acyl-coenzyme A synthetase/AMP-(fatty) acid ligase
VYGPLALGTTSVMYEGVPTYPDAGRLWRIAERLGVTIFHTAPTTIRMLRKLGPHEPANYDYHLKHMTTVGEPIEPEVWRWYHEVVGKREAVAANRISPMTTTVSLLPLRRDGQTDRRSESSRCVPGIGLNQPRPSLPVDAARGRLEAPRGRSVITPGAGPPAGAPAETVAYLDDGVSRSARRGRPPGGVTDRRR